MPMLLGCVLWLLICAIVAYILVLILEMALTLLVSLFAPAPTIPPQLFLAIRLLAVVFVLLQFLDCVGVMAGPWPLRRCP